MLTSRCSRMASCRYFCTIALIAEKNESVGKNQMIAYISARILNHTHKHIQQETCCYKIRREMDASDQIWLGDLVLIWLDSQFASGSHKDEIMHKLKSCISHLRTYDDPDQCVDYITRFAPTAKKIILIVSPKIGEIIIPLIKDLPQLISIYVFCHMEQSTSIDVHAEIFFSIDHMVHQLTKDAKTFLDQTVTSTIIYTEEKTFRKLSTKTDNVLVMWSKFLIQTLLNIPRTKYRGRHYLLYELGLQYKDDSRYQDEIKRFETTYESKDAIQWYTRDSFLYRILNQAFRTENIDLIYRYRFFFVDLYKNIERLHVEQQETLLKDANVLYRGQCINFKEFDQLYQNIGSFLVMNNFLSTTLTKELALIYSGDGEQKPNRESIIYEIHIDNEHRLSQPFANIREFSIFPDEDEILFATGTIFHLHSIYPEGNRWIVELILTDGKLSDTDDVNHYLNIYPEEESTLTRFGLILLRAGQYEKAEKYFQLQLLSHNAPPIRIDSSGPNNQDDFSQGLHYLLDRKVEISNSFYDNPFNHVILGGSPTQQELLLRQFHRRQLRYTGVTYNNLGLVNYSMGKFEKALGYYNQALEFYFRSAKLLHNHPLVEDSHVFEDFLPPIMLSRAHSNIGLTYLRVNAFALADKNFKLALKWYEKAVFFDKEQLIPYDALGAIYNNMGDLYATTLEFDLAIEYFNHALDTLSKSGAIDSDPAICNIYHNLASVYYSKNDIQSAVSTMHKSYILSASVLPSTHPDVQETLSLISLMQLNGESHGCNAVSEYKLRLQMLEVIQMHATKNYYRRGKVFFESGDYHIALENLLQCVELGLDETKLYTSIAYIYQKRDERQEAITFYEKAIQSTSDNDTLSQCYLSMVQLYMMDQDYGNALRLNGQRLQIVMNQLDHSELARIYSTNAELYLQIRDSRSELLNWEKAIDHGMKSNNNILLAEIYLRVGDAHFHHNGFYLAENYYQQAKSILQNPSALSPRNLYAAYNRLGVLYGYGSVDFKAAFAFYTKALRVAVADLTSTTNEIVANAYYDLSVLHLKTSDYPSAIDFSQIAIDTLLSASEKNDTTHLILQTIYFTLATIYLDNHNYLDSYETFRKLWLTGIHKDHPAYPLLRSLFYDEKNTGIAVLSISEQTGLPPNDDRLNPPSENEDE